MFRREERLMKCPQRETLLADPLDIKYSKIFYSPSGWSLTSLRPECSSLVLPVWLIALSRDLETIFHCLAQQKTFWTNSKFCQAWTNAVLVVLWSQLALIVWPLLQKQRAAFTLEVEGGESVTYSQTLLQQSTRAWKCSPCCTSHSTTHTLPLLPSFMAACWPDFKTPDWVNLLPVWSEGYLLTMQSQHRIPLPPVCRDCMMHTVRLMMTNTDY